MPIKSNYSWYVYVKRRPNGSPFYVGKGKGRRAFDHYDRSEYFKRILRKYGEKNIKTRLFFFQTEKQAFKHEIKLISRFRAEGHRLVNFTNGGEGASVKFTAQWVANVKKSRKKYVAKKYLARNGGRLKTIPIKKIIRIARKKLGIVCNRASVYQWLKRAGFPNHMNLGRPRRWREDFVQDWFKHAVKLRRRSHG